MKNVVDICIKSREFGLIEFLYWKNPWILYEHYYDLHWTFIEDLFPIFWLWVRNVTWKIWQKITSESSLLKNQIEIVWESSKKGKFVMYTSFCMKSGKVILCLFFYQQPKIHTPSCTNTKWDFTHKEALCVFGICRLSHLSILLNPNKFD